MESAEEKLNGLVTNAQIGVLGGYELERLRPRIRRLCRLMQLSKRCSQRQRPLPVNSMG